MPPSADNRNANLESAFRATRYRIGASGDRVEVVVGRRNEAADRLAEGNRWCILTAFNPRARRADDRRNRLAARRLEQRLVERSPQVLIPALNVDPDGTWPEEPGWFFTFERAEEVDTLADEFEQAAVVVGEPGQPARLRFYTPADEADSRHRPRLHSE